MQKETRRDDSRRVSYAVADFYAAVLIVAGPQSVLAES
ncbi:MAG: hypothetical protein K0R37_2138, partial [Arthrobacter sp.]|nr:hypothetical protein [Arthrobacter sp.]